MTSQTLARILAARRKPWAFFTKDAKTLDDSCTLCGTSVMPEQQIAKNSSPHDREGDGSISQERFETHLAQTKGQIVRLEKVFQMHGVEAKGVDLPCH
jgi:hypothetical protein